MSPERVDVQRDVVKNERRQSYENRPYGMAELELDTMLWPEGHPYSWSTIGSMEDLTAASHQDVQEFFRTYYAPDNASLVIAGDIDLAATEALVEKWFSDVPGGKPVPPVAPPAAMLTAVNRKTTTNRVELPRLYLAWLTPGLLVPATPHSTSPRRCSPAARTRGSTSGWSTSCRSPRTSSPTSSRSCSAAPSTCRRRRAPARPSKSCRR